MENYSDIMKAIFQGHILSWNLTDISAMLRKHYDTILTSSEINKIITNNPKKLNDYKTQLISGRTNLHKRIRTYGKFNNLNLIYTRNSFPQKKPSIEGYKTSRVNATTPSVKEISAIISIINGFYRISHSTVSSLFLQEFKSTFNITEYLTNLQLHNYNNKDNIFQRNYNPIIVEKQIDEIRINNDIYQLTYDPNSTLHINDTNKQIILKDEFSSIKFLFYCFKLKDIHSSPKINDFINQVTERV